MGFEHSPGDVYFHSELDRYYLCVTTVGDEPQAIAGSASCLKRPGDGPPELRFPHNMREILPKYNPLEEECAEHLGTAAMQDGKLVATLRDEEVKICLPNNFDHHFKPLD